MWFVSYERPDRATARAVIADQHGGERLPASWWPTAARAAGDAAGGAHALGAGLGDVARGARGLGLSPPALTVTLAPALAIWDRDAPHRREAKKLYEVCGPERERSRGWQVANRVSHARFCVLCVL